MSDNSNSHDEENSNDVEEILPDPAAAKRPYSQF